MLQVGRLKYFAAALTAVAMWGFFSIPLRNLREYPSEEILHYRIFTSLIVTGLLILLFRKKQVKQDLAYWKEVSVAGRKKLVGLILLAGVLITGNWFTFIYAVNHVSLSSAAFAYMVCPLITAMGGFLILKEELSALKLASIGIALISILILAQGSLVEVMWSVFIASLYAFYLIIQRVVVQIDKLNMLGIQLVISALLMLPFYIYQHDAFPTDWNFWINIIIISVFFTIIPLFLSMYALIGMPSSTMGIIIYLNPIIAFSVAFFYFHEQIYTYQLYAYGLLLAAVVVFNWNLISSLFLKQYKKVKTTNI
ncbi:MAG TPA: EamA family transporter [Daejeonella sp.]|nr:EamA family transporter [Daejeonella sp.]